MVATPAPESSETCPPHVWRRLLAIRVNRLNSKTREQDLIGTRNSLAREIAQLERQGKTGTKKHHDRLSDYASTLFSLDYQRERKRRLADLFEETLEKGIQREFFDESEPMDFTLDTFQERLATQKFKGDKAEGEEGTDDDDPKQQSLEPSPGDPMKPREDDKAGSANVRRMETEENVNAPIGVPVGQGRYPARFVLKSGKKNVRPVVILADSDASLEASIAHHMNGQAFTFNGTHVLVGNEAVLAVEYGGRINPEQYAAAKETAAAQAQGKADVAKIKKKREKKS